MCRVILNASERQSVADAMIFITEKGINSLIMLPNKTEEEKTLKEVAILELVSELVLWFEDVDASCAKMISEKSLFLDEPILIKKNEKEISFDGLLSIEKDIKKVFEKSNNILRRLGYILNPKLFLKLV